MVRTGLEKFLKKHHVLEKSLKIEKLWEILENSLNIFESSMNKNNLFKKRKKVLRKGRLESTAVCKFCC